MMKLCFALAFIFVTLEVTGQSMGNGIAKSTWAATDPRECLAHWEKYAPGVTEEDDDCTNGKCECATQGRGHVIQGSSPWQHQYFQMHAINCTYHPEGEYGITYVENIWQSYFNDFKDGLHPFMEYNLGIYTPDLDSVIEKLESDSVPHLKLVYKYKNKDYYGVLTNPCGMVVTEYMGDSTSNPSAFTRTANYRFLWNDDNNIQNSYNVSPFKISRCASDLDAIDDYYSGIMGATLLDRSEFDDGTIMVSYQMPNPGKVHIQFWYHPEMSVSKAKGSEPDFTTVKGTEDYINSVHESVWESNVCGFDKWIDFHFGFDAMPGPGSSFDLSSVVRKLDNQGFFYHYWNAGQVTQVYAADPTGWGIQFDGQVSQAPRRLPSYTAACKSNDGCEAQGLCTGDDNRQFWDLKL